MRKSNILMLALLISAVPVLAQKDNGKGVSLRGSIQSDILIPQEDLNIGTGTYKEWALTNTYADLMLQSKYVEAGARVEFLEFPLPGFESDFKGWGLPHLYVKGKYKWAELTAGDYYEQFGSGFVLRTYEERSLGIDNSLRGDVLCSAPIKVLL